MIINCDLCRTEKELPISHVNRSKAKGAPIYCGRACAGLARRKGRTQTEKVERKRIYDAEYRRKNAAMLKAKKAKHFRKTYDPEKARIERKGRAAAHAEYCRRPEYKAWKAQYDRIHRAKERYGEFWECFLTLQDIEAEIASQATKYEIYLANGTLGKTQKRKRDYERIISTKSEAGALGNFE